MLAINKINHIGFLLSLLTLFSFSCYPDNKNCPEIKIGKDYTGYGVLLYFDDSQDGMNSLFFFPCCNYSNGEIDSISFWKETFKKGISFRLPRYSSIFKKIKNKAKIFNDDYRGKTHFDYVNIRFSNNKSSMSSYSKDKNYWNLYFSANGQKKTLQYYISDSLQISELNSL